ncbi:hypothetical protein TWF694_003365 [Orbilia ellipsospora]|uniref:SCP domain-containing protein n=1 Tax=Orbilia ellipsospora TaxID=2528407 RepID=A0AAV9WXY6_9PEZI
MKASFTLLMIVLAATSSCAPTLETRQNAAFVPEAEYKDSVLKMHNEVRALHGEKPLTWSSELVKFGISHTPDCIFQHTGRPALDAAGLGENILFGLGNTAQEGRQTWYDKERPLYDFKKPGFSMETGHFTQMIWRSTTEVGCAVRKCGDRTMVKCNYRAPGNFPDQFEANVFPPK